MSSDLPLIGSAPVETAEDMLRQVEAPLADFLGSIPDGRARGRRWWVHRDGHPDLKTIRRPMPDNGSERFGPHDRSDTSSSR